MLEIYINKTKTISHTLIGSDWSNISEKKSGKVENTISILLLLLEIINTLLFKFWDNFSFHGKATLHLLLLCFFFSLFLLLEIEAEKFIQRRSFMWLRRGSSGDMVSGNGIGHLSMLQWFFGLEFLIRTKVEDERESDLLPCTLREIINVKS